MYFLPPYETPHLSILTTSNHISVYYIVTERSHDACYSTTICTSAITIFLLKHY